MATKFHGARAQRSGIRENVIAGDVKVSMNNLVIFLGLIL